jgi:hypothetical protein
MWVRMPNGSYMNLAHAWSVWTSDNGVVSITWSTAKGKESEDFTGDDAIAIVTALERTQRHDDDDDSVSGIINQAFKENLKANFAKQRNKRR